MELNKINALKSKNDRYIKSIEDRHKVEMDNLIEAHSKSMSDKDRQLVEKEEAMKAMVQELEYMREKYMTSQIKMLEVNYGMRNMQR